MTNQLPSHHQIGEKVNACFMDSGTLFNCEVIAVRFTESKVLYDLGVPLNSESFTTIVGVDSICVKSQQPVGNAAA